MNLHLRCYITLFQSRYQALNIASLYIPFDQPHKKRNGPFRTSGVYFILLFAQWPGPFSFPPPLPLT